MTLTADPATDHSSMTSSKDAFTLTFLITQLAYTVCIDTSEPGPLVLSDCPSKVLTCFMKNPPDKVGTDTMIHCAKSFFKNELP
jgi:hypothetical protein